MTEVALFGAGRIGKIHAGNLARQPGVKLRYVVDVDARGRGGARRAAWRAVGSVETVLADPAVGAVVIGVVDRHARRPDHARRGRGQGDLLRKAGGPGASIVRAPARTRCSARAWPA